MPELPEVEVVRLFLESKLTNKTISNLEIITPKSFIGNPKAVIGQKIIKFTRLGKQLSIHLQNKLIILFHLKMTGQIIYSPFSLKGVPAGRGIFGHPTKDAFTVLPNKSTRLIFTFSDKSRAFFNDQRKFGWVKILTQSELKDFQKNIGLDILSSDFTDKYFYQQLQTTSRPIKSVLLDQNKFAGIGNIYANDALFLAKINPMTSSKKISRPKSKILHQYLIDLMKESISHGGSTAKDNKYIHPDGTVGQHQYHFRVYQRDKQPCLICQTPIKRIKIGGRGTFFCPNCQK
ncbi:MAG: bifunctional DNA-formamidopyrimidine glycosylase/DNA-(apurinic or apyrimidinic site) lyase [Candidatus Shapirobacteria bacterium]|nr:bifunctional DNA-formamidopyrimidine glycosylase/DNA-(apurinic or apyrimidinic site) lyase [Candidatus Shapirobacteria bacterium]